MAKLEDLRKEATELGIDFSKQLGEAKLQAKIDAFYEAQETQEDAIAEAVEAKEKEVAKEPAVKTSNRIGELAKKLEAAARKTKIVTIIDNDQRENMHTTSCTANCGNEWFDLGQIILPLNIPVEVMQGHIDVLKDVEIPMHVKDIKSGLSRTELRKRFSISTEDQIIKD